MSNRLIVESKNDQYFFQALINYLNINLEVDSINIKISDEDYQCLGGSDHKLVKGALSDLKVDVQKGKIQRAGIIVDIDNHSILDRLALVNECLQYVFSPSVQLFNINEFISIPIDDDSFEFACYFTNVNGKGELDTLLRSIKGEESTYADCLKRWRDCMESHGKNIKDKEFDKFWVRIYLRYDTCSKKEERHVHDNCGFQGVMQNKDKVKNIWNLEHPDLLELKDFLRLFTNSKVET